MEPGHWAFVASGVDGDCTLRANREAFQHIELRPRRLHDATKVDMRVNLFGAAYSSPIFACPTGGAKTFNPEGELAIARAAKARGALQFLSTGTSISVEEVNAALRPAGVVSALCPVDLGSLRTNAAARGSRRMHGDRALPSTRSAAATAKPTCARSRKT